MDLLLNTAGDLDLTTGDLQLTSGTPAISQHISIRLKFFLGEWFLDTRLGIPYFEQILVKNPRTNVVRSILEDAVRTTPGVLAVNDFVADYVSASRRLDVSFSAQVTTSDEPLDFSQEFII